MAEYGFPQAHNVKTPPYTSRPNNGGTTVIGYPVSGFSHPSTSTNSAAAVEAPEVEAPVGACNRLLCGCLLNVSFMSFMIISLIYGLFLIPPLPGVSIISASTNVTSNYVIEDLDVRFSVQNKARKGMILKKITLQIYHGKDDDERLSYDDERLSNDVVLPLNNLELQGKDDHETVWFNLKNLLVPIDKWESSANGSVSTLAVGLTRIGFNVRARVRYRGKAWSKQEITMYAVCRPVKIKLDPGHKSNATKETQNFNARSCEGIGLWNYLKFFPLAMWLNFILLGLIYVGTTLCNRHCAKLRVLPPPRPSS